MKLVYIVPFSGLFLLSCKENERFQSLKINATIKLCSTLTKNACEKSKKEEILDEKEKNGNYIKVFPSSFSQKSKELFVTMKIEETLADEIILALTTSKGTACKSNRIPIKKREDVTHIMKCSPDREIEENAFTLHILTLDESNSKEGSNSIEMELKFETFE